MWRWGLCHLEPVSIYRLSTVGEEWVETSKTVFARCVGVWQVEAPHQMSIALYWLRLRKKPKRIYRKVRSSWMKWSRLCQRTHSVRKRLWRLFGATRMTDIFGQCICWHRRFENVLSHKQHYLEVSIANLTRNSTLMKPEDLMIQLKPVIMSRAGTQLFEQTLVPEGILHPRFAQRKSGASLYITGDQYVLQQLLQKRKCCIFSCLEGRKSCAKTQNRTAPCSSTRSQCIPTLSIAHYTPTSAASYAGS